VRCAKTEFESGKSCEYSNVESLNFRIHATVVVREFIRKIVG
jgi:hypothetical protein